MNKFFLSLVLISSFFIVSAQQNGNSSVQPGFAAEMFPVFPNCENLDSKKLESCFYKEVQDFVFSNFQVPQKLKENNYKGVVKVLFEVNAEGEFKVIYVSAGNEELSEEAKRVFGAFPKIKPSTYNGKPTYSKYTISIDIPLKNADQIAAEALAASQILKPVEKPMTELDSIVYKKYNNPEFDSHLNIPFSHSYYAQFDGAMNQVGSNNHTASKPYTYEEVSKYYNLKAVNESLQKNVSTWLGRKFWNQNMVQIQGEDYWLALNPIVDLQMGKASDLDASYSFGSFNTHRSTINAGYTAKSGFTTEINAFQNYSDNNYWVNVDVADLKTGQYYPNQRVRRFHDKYRNETVIFNISYSSYLRAIPNIRWV